VCQNKDPENLGRVKVRLPWLDGGDTDQTHWAAVMTPMEGDKFGWYTLPDVDDVVVVMFIAGDASQPVVLGGVWSTKDNAPETNEDGKNNFRGYRSRSGARLILDDSSKGKVVVSDKSGKNVVAIGQFDSDGAGPNVCAAFKPPMAGSAGVAIASMEGSLEVSCGNGKLTIQAQQNIKLSAATTVDVKAGTDLQLQGSTTAKLTSSAAANFDAPQVGLG
jgi:uncharacterized protein involved in type VI secretion and phage assembly